jgi:pyruvate formate lyase activating enzyme
VLAFLETRRGLLDGVVFSGGEPTLQRALPEAVHAVRERGFRVGLHTAGPYPERLARLLPLLDWIGFDVKAPFADYARITRVPGSGERARRSLIAVAHSGVAFEVRTTVHPLLTGEDDLARLDADLAALGIAPSRRQPFRPIGCRDEELVAIAAVVS